MPTPSTVHVVVCPSSGENFVIEQSSYGPACQLAHSFIDADPEARAFVVKEVTRSQSPTKHKRPCDNCGNNQFHRFSSINEKRCTNCGERRPWKLKSGQAPLVGSNRQKRGD